MISTSKLKLIKIPHRLGYFRSAVNMSSKYNEEIEILRGESCENKRITKSHLYFRHFKHTTRVCSARLIFFLYLIVILIKHKLKIIFPSKWKPCYFTITFSSKNFDKITSGEVSQLKTFTYNIFSLYITYLPKRGL